MLRHFIQSTRHHVATPARPRGDPRPCHRHRGLRRPQPLPDPYGLEDLGCSLVGHHRRQCGVASDDWHCRCGCRLPVRRVRRGRNVARRAAHGGSGTATQPPSRWPPSRSCRSIAGSRALVLLAATMALVVFSTIALAAGVVWHARQPVTLSLVAIPVAVATLVFYTRTVRTAGSDDAWAPEAGLRVSRCPPPPPRVKTTSCRGPQPPFPPPPQPRRVGRAARPRPLPPPPTRPPPTPPVVVPTTSFNRQPITEPTFVGAASQPPPTSIVSSQPPPDARTPSHRWTDAAVPEKTSRRPVLSGYERDGDRPPAGCCPEYRVELARALGARRRRGARIEPSPRLTAARLAPIREALDRGPQASGYPTDAWTLAQVTEVIERLTGVRYEPNRVRRIFRDRMGWEADRLVS